MRSYRDRTTAPGHRARAPRSEVERPPYLVLDPTDDYPRRMVEFLARQGLRGVAVLTSAMRAGQWQHGWEGRYGDALLTAVDAADQPAAAVAERLHAAFPHGLLGVVPWDERSVLWGAELGERLGLHWNPHHVIERCRDKAVMKDHLRRAGTVRINAGAVVHDAAEAVEFQHRLGKWPVVVKPTGGAGSAHVSFAHDRGELLRGCQEVLESGDGEVLLEEFVGGRELAVNGMVDRDGDFLPTDIWLYDRRESHGFPNLYYETVKLDTTSPLFWPLARYASRVLETLGLRRAPVHMEVKVDDHGPCLIEVGARLAGGNQPALASMLHGRSLFELAACHYLDELKLVTTDVDWARYDRYAARIVSGIQPVALQAVTAVHGVEEVQSLPSFAGLGLLRRPGMPLPQTRDLRGKSYEVYLMHRDREQVAHDARMVRRLLRYE
jgi:biotin carboxylase